MLSRATLLPVALLLTLSSGGCDSRDDSCANPPESVAPGSFALRYQEDGGRCLLIRGEYALFQNRPAVFSTGDVFVARLVPDDDEVGGASTTFVQFLSIGGDPLGVGEYEVADLFERSDVPNAPPAGDVRFIEQTGKVSIGLVLDQGPTFSTGGDLTVTRSTSNIVEGRFDATFSTRDGPESAVVGTFSVERGEGDINFGYF